MSDEIGMTADRLARGGNTHHHAGLPRQSGQQPGKTRQEAREQADATARAHAAYGGGEIGVDRVGDTA